MRAYDDNLTSERKQAQVMGKVKVIVARVKGKLEHTADQINEALKGKRSSRSDSW
jgi:hypothetical protein